EAEGILAICREVGYHHIEAVAERLLGEALTVDDPEAAAQHLETARLITEEIGAKSELAKTLLAHVALYRAAGDTSAALQVASLALAISEELGTIDDTARARRIIGELDQSQNG